ncbi:MAG: hybrid sensor histidine kinase/response regulator [Planctomycetes bacterium]|nr:hybrid sensor histidine kinase/response regulator [Planctomycetota bacterium]
MQRKTRVLAIDDSPENLFLLRCILRREGIETIEAPDAERGKALAVSERPDLILLDVMMPGKDGFTLCRELSEDPETRRIPIIFVTALSEREAVLKGFEAGAVDYVLKPFDGAEILARARTHLRLRAETEARMQYQAACCASRKRAMLGDLMAGFAHNFNNLLVVTTGNIELALRDQMEPDEKAERLGTALEATRSMAGMVARITRYLGREAAHAEESDGVFSIAEEVRNIGEIFASALPRRIAFELGDVGATARVKGDPEGFREILTALLQNAYEAIPSDAGGRISVGVEMGEKDGDPVRIWVRDSGRGMDPDTLQRATTPFFSTKYTTGNGLGLTMAESFAMSCSGRLELDSAPGEGTRVSLVLPVVKEAAVVAP